MPIPPEYDRYVAVRCIDCDAEIVLWQMEAGEINRGYSNVSVERQCPSCGGIRRYDSAQFEEIPAREEVQ